MTNPMSGSIEGGGTTLATLLGVDERTVRRLRQRGIIKPINEDSKRPVYNFLDSARAYIDFKRDEAIGRRSPGSGALMESKLRRIKSRVDLAKQKLDKTSSEISLALDVEACTGVLNDVITRIINRLPGAVAPHLAGVKDLVEAAVTLEEHSRDLLEELAETLQGDEFGLECDRRLREAMEVVSL